MKNLKSENGAITMIVLITVIFFVSFLISSYILVANKAKLQKEIVEETRKIYEPTSTMEEIYNSYFDNGNIIPIYNMEQLEAMGSEEKININGKYYTFSNDENTIYVLMNNIEINAYEDYGEEYYWTPIGNRNLLANFEGNNYKIDVIYNDKTKTYSKENEFSEYFVIGINPTPADAIVTLNGKETKTISVKQGEEVEWKVEKIGYVTQGGKHIADNDGIYDIILESEECTFTINPTPADAIVTISSNGEILTSGQGSQSVLVEPGTNIEYSVEAIYYYSKTGSAIVDSTTTQTVELESKPEQTLIIAKPSRVEAEDWTDVQNADDGIDSTDYAQSWNTDKFYLYYDAGEINENVKVTKILARYRLKQTLSGNHVAVILNVGDIECINTIVENISTKLRGTVYESVSNVLLKGANLKKGLTLTINNIDGGIDILYIYGSEIVIKYIEP